MKYYKVVYTEPLGHLVSTGGVGIVRYEIGAWTKPKIFNSKLFVFNDWKCAMEYLCMLDWTGQSRRKAYECHVRGVEKVPRRLIAQPFYLDVVSYWAGDPCYYGMTPPRGTVCVDKVKLVRKVA